MPWRLWVEKSAQRRIAIQTSLAVCLALAGGIYVSLMAHEVADDAIFDEQLGHFSRTIASAVADEMPRLEAPGNSEYPLIASVRAQSGGLLYQVWGRDGSLLRQSPQSSLTVPLAPLEAKGFSTRHIEGVSYRIHSLPSSDGKTVVQVAEQIEDRDNMRLFLLPLYAAALLLPLYITWRSSRRIMERSRKILSTLAARVDRQDPQDAGPVPMEKPPSDFAPLMESVNGLMQRASNVIALEQRFTSVAAHELRSPLAGIRAQAQLAGRAESDQELQQSLQGVMAGVDQVSRLLEQLLDLTRMEGLSQDRWTHFKPVDLQAVSMQVHDEVRPLLLRKNMNYRESFRECDVLGVEFAIYLLLRNLVANAILYTPEGGSVEVSSVLQADELLLIVDDSGPGIAEADRQRVFERYCRLNRSNSEGIGLGLSIAQQAARLHNSSIQLLTSPLGGLRAQVALPLVSPPGPGAN